MRQLNSSLDGKFTIPQNFSDIYKLRRKNSYICGRFNIYCIPFEKIKFFSILKPKNMVKTMQKNFTHPSRYPSPSSNNLLLTSRHFLFYSKMVFVRWQIKHQSFFIKGYEIIMNIRVVKVEKFDILRTMRKTIFFCKNAFFGTK